MRTIRYNFLAIGLMLIVGLTFAMAARKDNKDKPQEHGYAQRQDRLTTPCPLRSMDICGDEWCRYRVPTFISLRVFTRSR